MIPYRKKIYFIVFFIFFFLFLTTSKIWAKSKKIYRKSHKIPVKTLKNSYSLYLVKKGDTLYSISKKLGIPIEEIKNLNNLTSLNLKEGQILKVPSLSIKIEPKTEESKYHIVKKGETLYRIAKKYNITLEELKKLNNLRDNNLKLGQKLIISKNYSIHFNNNFLIHEVKEGETLYRISLHYNVPIEILKSINHIEDNVVFVGQKLKIPYSQLEETPFILENPAIVYQEKPEDLLPQKLSKFFLNKSILDKEEENFLRQKFLEISHQYREHKYKIGGDGNGYLDCSMFVKLVYQNFGIDLPRTSREQFQVGIEVEKEELIPGDLLFFSRDKTRENISHVGIYIGDNKFIHFSSSRRGLSIDSLEEDYFKNRFVGAKRILKENIIENFFHLKKQNS